MAIKWSFETKNIKMLYLCVAAILAIFFIAMLFRPFTAAFHEQDLWWMIPTLSQLGEGSSLADTLKTHLFNPYPTNWGEPSMNLYLYFIMSVFGPQTKYFIFVSVLLHFFCAILLYFFLRESDFDFRVAFFTALAFAFMFIHFSYYEWPMAAQHLMAIFLTLLVLYLYLKTTRRMDSGEKWRTYFRLTLLANLLASFGQISILILPASVLAHILICSKDGDDRVKKYDIWLPLFITYLGYFLIRNFYWGYPNLQNYMRAIPAVILSRLQLSNAYSPVLFPVIFAFGISGMFLLRLVLKAYGKIKIKGLSAKLLIGSVALYLVTFLFLYSRKGLFSSGKVMAISWADFMSPYNTIRPFMGAFAVFLYPLKAALSVDSAKAYHYIPMFSGLVLFVFCAFFVSAFFKKFFMKHKAVIVFFIFYVFASRMMTEILLRKQDSIPSRYFVYITPLISLVFCSVFLWLYFLLIDKTRIKKAISEVVLLAVFAGICAANVTAIKFELFKGRLTNTFAIYDYIKTSVLIKNDLRARGVTRLKPADIYINGVIPMPYSAETGCSFSIIDPQRFDVFRYAFSQVFNDDRMLRVNVNKTPLKEGAGIYAVDDGEITGAAGVGIDPFSRDYRAAMKELGSGHYEEASVLFQSAVRQRTFLLKYVLAGYGLEDTGWITNGRSMRQWINEMAACYFHVKKYSSVSASLNKEIDHYIECLFYAAYLKYLAGEKNESNHYFSLIRFLDGDEDAVLLRLSARPFTRSDPRISEFLKDVKSRVSYRATSLRQSSFLDFIRGLFLNKDMII